MSDYSTAFPGTAEQVTADMTSNTGTATGTGTTASNGAFIATAPAATTGINDPQTAMYAGYRAAVGNDTVNHHAQAYTTSANPADLSTSLKQNVYDPWGPISRPEGGRQYQGPWVNPWDATTYAGTQYRADNGFFKYNQMLMTVAQNFDPFMQKKEMSHPHWWLNRVPRTAYKLFDGAVHETRIYRGGLSVYSGLSDWEDLAPDPTTKDACAPMQYRTYQYAWETRAWSGKKTAWGSDPICLDIFRFTPHAIEQLGWILETGVKFGTDIQNIWNRDMFIYHSVMAGRSYVMTSEFRGAGSPRYVYEPYCKFVADADKGELKASRNYVKKPFVVIDASSNVEPLNFDVLDIFRKQLERQCPEAAVGRYGTGLMFALAVSEEDVEKYIRGNEEERKYWIEANPQALIQHYGFAPTTFRRWTITCDGDQLRFHYIRRIASYTEAEAVNYGYVGYKELAGKPVFIAEAVDPEYGARGGVNGAPVPEANPKYDLAELAIAPVFMNNVFTNQFVPDTPSLGHGTWFGPKKGLNGKWGWFNPQTKENLEQKVGNFYGIFEIVPKPETSAIYATSFIYRRCAEPLPSLCPSENPKVNRTAKSTATVSGEPEISTDSTTGLSTATLVLSDALLGASTGDELTLTASGTTVRVAVFSSLTGTKKQVQIEADPAAVQAYKADDVVVDSGHVYVCETPIATYSNTATYAKDALVAVTTGTGADAVTDVYKALQSATGQAPASSATYWSKVGSGTHTTVADMLGEAFAQVTLDGATVAVA